MIRNSCRKRLVSGIAVLCLMTASFGFAALAQEKTSDPLGGSRRILSCPEFERMVLDAAIETGVPPGSIMTILHSLKKDYSQRIIRPQELRFILLSLLYQEGVPYENARKLIEKACYSSVDTGFLDYLQSLSAGDGESSGTTPYVVGVAGVAAPVVVHQPLPAYTDAARQAKVEGIVVLRAVIGKDGTVRNPVVIRGLGYGLDESAIITLMKKWQFKPGTLNGVPVDVQATIEVSFRLY